MMLLSPTVSFVLYHTYIFYVCMFLRITLLSHHCTILCIYDAFVRRLSVLLYSTVRFYVLCMFLRITLLLHHCTILRIYDATVRRLSVLFYTTVRFYTSTMLLYADCQFCFIPLYVSTYYVRFYGSLCFYTTVRFYASMMLLYADCLN